ncbi:MAG: NAD-dependent deacylase [Ignavibacteriales bacterium]|nr:MAG: NAD-dependent deacylase [Ignavibacteriales bacterium]
MTELNPVFLDKLGSARKITFFTGAGMSAESGIPTFRGEDGIWKKFRPEELANFKAFVRSPEMVWEWYQHRRQIITECLPHPGHHAIKDLESKFSVTVITQNIDDLHNRAGSSRVIELHGNILKNYCLSCKKRYDHPAELHIEGTPRCTCGGLIRPDVVWFGENLPEGVFERAEDEVISSDILFSVGTSSIVYPAASLPHTAIKRGVYVVEINPVETEFTEYADLFLKGKAGEILPQIVKALS